MKKSAKFVLYTALNINENLMLGYPEAIDEAVKQLKKNRLVLKVLESLKDYVWDLVLKR